MLHKGHSKEVRFRFLMAAAGAGVVDLQMEEA